MTETGGDVKKNREMKKKTNKRNEANADDGAAGKTSENDTKTGGNAVNCSLRFYGLPWKKKNQILRKIPF